jgi:hypothetical protein
MVGAYFWTARYPVELDGSYARGFEDAVELCYAKVNAAKTLEEAQAEIEEIWGKVKSRKVWVVERQISEIWGT